MLDTAPSPDEACVRDMTELIELPENKFREGNWVREGSTVSLRYIAPLLLVAACASDPDGVPDVAPDGGLLTAVDMSDAVDQGAANRDWQFEVLERRPVTVNELSTNVELVRAIRPDGLAAYLQYIHAALEPAPLVVVEQPYAGISWSGDSIDERWAAAGDGIHDDADGPAYDGDDVIGYQERTVQSLVDESVVWLANGISVVHVFGRFYAGRSIDDTLLDAAAGFHFAASRPGEVHLERVGAFGGSWGGMMALFGLLHAPESVRVRAVAALTPVSDFADFVSWASDEIPELYHGAADVRAFFSPYLRRVFAAVGHGVPTSISPEEWRPFTRHDVCGAAERQGAAVMLYHDDWDLLIPVRQSLESAAACSAMEAIVWPREPVDYETASFNHGPAPAELEFPIMFSFAMAQLAVALTPVARDVIIVAQPESLHRFLDLLHAARDAGRDIDSLATPALANLCDSRVTYIAPDGSGGRGASLVSRELNSVFGTATTAENVCPALIGGLLGT